MSLSAQRYRRIKHADSMCESKVRYADKKAVQSAINAFANKRGRHGRPNALRAYPCPLCKGWHLTKKD